MKKRKEKECECKECECKEVPTTCVAPDAKDSKKKVGIIVGIGAGLAAVGAAIAGIFVAKKKREEKEEEE